MSNSRLLQQGQVFSMQDTFTIAHGWPTSRSRSTGRSPSRSLVDPAWFCIEL